MSMQVDFVAVQKRCLGDGAGGHPNSKRFCKGLESAPKENGVVYHPLKECLLDYWDMQLLQTQQHSVHEGFLENVMEKHSSMIFQNHESEGSVQPCPRCIAGESGHINHMIGH